MAISTTRAKQIRKSFRKNYGPKPKVTTADVKGRRRAVKAGQTTYAKKDGTTGQLTRAQKLRTMQNLNKTAKRKKMKDRIVKVPTPKPTKPPKGYPDLSKPVYGGPNVGTYPNADDMTFVVGRPRPGKKRPGKTQPGKRNPKLDGTFVAKKKMRGGGMAKMAKKKMMRGGSVQAKKMRGGGMAKMAKKKMMRGGVAKKK